MNIELHYELSAWKRGPVYQAATSRPVIPLTGRPPVVWTIDRFVVADGVLPDDPHSNVWGNPRLVWAGSLFVGTTQMAPVSRFCRDAVISVCEQHGIIVDDSVRSGRSNVGAMRADLPAAAWEDEWFRWEDVDHAAILNISTESAEVMSRWVGRGCPGAEKPWVTLDLLADVRREGLAEVLVGRSD